MNGKISYLMDEASRKSKSAPGRIQSILNKLTRESAAQRMERERRAEKASNMIIERLNESIEELRLDMITYIQKTIKAEIR